MKVCDHWKVCKPHHLIPPSISTFQGKIWQVSGRGWCKLEMRDIYPTTTPCVSLLRNNLWGVRGISPLTDTSINQEQCPGSTRSPVLQERTETLTFGVIITKLWNALEYTSPHISEVPSALIGAKKVNSKTLGSAHPVLGVSTTQSSKRKERDLSVSHGWGDVGHLTQCKILCPILDSSQNLESEKRAGEPGWSMDVGRPHGPLLSDGNRIANQNLPCVPRTA